MLLSTALSARNANDLRERGRPGRRHTPGGRRSSRPRLELLESRTLLNVDFVQNNNDNGIGSLRDTLNNASPGDTIEFASNVQGTITLTSGTLDIEQDVQIEGPGANDLAISGNQNGFDVFFVDDGRTATIAGLTIADSSFTGITSYGDLTVADCTIVNNSESGIVTTGVATITNSTIAGNSTTSEGGGIANTGMMSVTNSTIAGNAAANGYGGGILTDGTATITNSTIAGNSAGYDGGGLEVYQGTASIANTIIAGNTAADGPDVGDRNGGAITSKGHNLIGNSSGGDGFVATDLLNVNPLLGPLQDNGGPTLTMALLPGSPAIDAGSNALVPLGINADQRGAPRNVDGVDIGAFEAQVYPVTSVSDSGTGSLRIALDQANEYGGSSITFSAIGVIELESPLPAILRDVQILGPGANVLTVHSAGASPVFQVDDGATATIAGMTISGGSAPDGSGIENIGTLTVADATLSGNNAYKYGGGIENFGSLTVTNSTLTGNDASYGGDIYNDGTATIDDSTLSASIVTDQGGAIYNYSSGTMTIINSTVTGNEANNAGGILNGGALTIEDSTVSMNSAEAFGGIWNAGTAAIANTIVADDKSAEGVDVYGTFTSKGYNLIGDSSGGSGFTGTDLLNVNPLLGFSENNGGSTATMALLPGSPAIGAGSIALVPSGISTDERGIARIVSGRLDIGAFESRGFTISVASGDNQTTVNRSAFPAPLVVTVRSPAGDPVEGGVVTFNAPSTGPSATFAGGSNTAAINASGQAKIAVTANGAAGGYALGATASGAAGTSFGLTNMVGPPAKLVIHTQPSAQATAGRAFATEPVIYIEDLSGDLEAADSTTKVTVAILGGGGRLVGKTTVTAVGGIVRFVGLSDNKAARVSLRFTSPSLTGATSNPIFISSKSSGMAVPTRSERWLLQGTSRHSSALPSS